MAVQTSDVLKWLEEVCAQALTEARSGNTMLANRLGGNPALQHYFNNVHTIKAVEQRAWAVYYPDLMREATRLYEEYIQSQGIKEAAAKVSTLETKLESLEKLIRELVEAKAAPVTEDAAPVVAEVPAVDKKARKAKAKVAAVTPDNGDDDDEAEDAETTEEENSEA